MIARWESTGADVIFCDVCGVECGPDEPMIVGTRVPCDCDDTGETWLCGSDCCERAGFAHPRVPPFVRAWFDEHSTGDDWAGESAPL